MIKSRV